VKKPLLFYLSFIIGLSSVTSCRKVGVADPCQPLVDVKIYPQDSVVALSSRLNGDCLQLTIDYRGGCATHDFALCWEGILATSRPPQTAIVLLHDNGLDPCDELQTTTMSFDLSRLHEVYDNAIIVRIVATGAEAIRFTYN
jgi:hypothetical protein